MADALAVSRQLIDDSQAGGYSAIATQFHVDYYPYDEVKPWVDGTLAYAASQQIPMWTAGALARASCRRAPATTITDLAWNAAAGLLTFTHGGPGRRARPQSLMLPPAFGDTRAGPGHASTAWPSSPGR